MNESLVRIVTTDDEPKPTFLRGEALAWTTIFPSTARSLGRQVVSELATFKDFSDGRILEIAIGLADQKPPMPTEISWGFHDGIRDGLEDRRADEEFSARTVVAPAGEINV